MYTNCNHKFISHNLMTVWHYDAVFYLLSIHMSNVWLLRISAITMNVNFDLDSFIKHKVGPRICHAFLVTFPIAEQERNTDFTYWLWLNKTGSQQSFITQLPKASSRVPKYFQRHKYKTRFFNYWRGWKNILLTNQLYFIPKIINTFFCFLKRIVQ